VVPLAVTMPALTQVLRMAFGLCTDIPMASLLVMLGSCVLALLIQ
jgi:hypothetical protein